MNALNTYYQRLAAATEHYKGFCEALGIDVSSDDTRDTPARVARMMYWDFTAGLREPEFKITTFPVTPETANQLVNVCGIRLVSICSHHHLPFTGLCHVCYLPGDRLVGLSKIPRLISWVAAQPSVQEDLSNKIRSKLVEYLKPRFVGVRLIAEHSCMTTRGAKERDATMSTDAFWCTNEKGKEGRPLDMADFETTKQEFFQAIKEWYDYQRR